MKKADRSQCGECGKCYSKATNLNRHVREAHRTDFNGFCCRICGKTYKQKSKLFEHQRVYGHGAPTDFVAAQDPSTSEKTNPPAAPEVEINSTPPPLQMQTIKRPASAPPVDFVTERIMEVRPASAPLFVAEQCDNWLNAEMADVEDLCSLWDPASHYEILSKDSRHSKRLKTTMSDYSIKFRGLDYLQFPSGYDKLHSVMDSLISEIKAEAPAEGSKGRFVVRAPGLDPIQVRYGDLTDLNATTLTNQISKTLQSKKTVQLDENMSINFLHSELPVGGARSKNQGAIGTRSIYDDSKEYRRRRKAFIDPGKNDKLNMCLARSLVVARYLTDKFQKGQDPRKANKEWVTMRAGKLQTTEAKELHFVAGIPIGPMCTIDDVASFQTVLNGYQINVFSWNQLGTCIYSGPENVKHLNICFFDMEHHFCVIKSMSAFMHTDYYCSKCLRGYNHKDRHLCGKASCKFCAHADCDNNGEVMMKITCEICKRVFKTEACVQAHKDSCDRYIVCQICCRTVPRSKLEPPEAHHCMELMCTRCGGWKNPVHLCYVAKPKSSEKSIDNDGAEETIFDLLGDNDPEEEEVEESETDKPAPKYYFGDFECVIDPETKVHSPCLLVVQDMMGSEMIFQGADCADQFLKRCMEDKALVSATVIFHNFSGYDSYPMLDAIGRARLTPDIILRASRCLTMKLKGSKVRFIDSAQFLNMPLASLPKAMALEHEVGCKGEFPYLLPGFEPDYHKNAPPPLHYFDPENRKPDDYKKLLKWHAAEVTRYANDPDMIYDIHDQMRSYCSQDVTILRRCCTKFRGIMMGLFSNIDPFESITLPSYCNKVYRTLHMPENSVAILPPQGYGTENYSKSSICWLVWESTQRNVPIRHARNSFEIKIGPYKVDGYAECGADKLVFEFNGCRWHGHNCKVEYANAALYEACVKRAAYLTERGYTVIEQWECEFWARVRQNKEISAFVGPLFARLKTCEPLRPRESMRGGRTNAITLFCEPDVTKGESLHYYDFTSLYPSVNMGCNGEQYPVGHPSIHLHSFPDAQKLFGLWKGTLLPPKKLFHPVLLLFKDSKVLYGLCEKCMDERNQHSCDHSDNEREIEGTFVSVELQKALQLGYTIRMTHEVWHWPASQRSTTLMRDFIVTAYREKVEASGWPENCDTEEHRAEYVRNYLDRQGVKLRVNNIEKNPGRRTVGKTVVTTLWGYLAKYNNHGHCKIVSDYAEYCKIVTDNRKVVYDAYLLNEDQLAVYYKDPVEQPDRHGNVVLGTFTTSHARLRLYELLERLGPRALYMDTDSVIWLKQPSEPDLQTGDLMGELTDEILKDYGSEAKIELFASSGPKSYCVSVVDKCDGSVVDNIVKMKGIRCSERCRTKICPQTIQAAVRQMDETMIPQAQICRNKRKWELCSKDVEKKFRLTYNKRRRITDSFETLPFGWVDV